MRCYLSLAAKPLVHGVQDGVLYDILVDLFSSLDNCQLGDHRRQTQGGVVCQRHVTNLHQKGQREKGEGEENQRDNETPLPL